MLALHFQKHLISYLIELQFYHLFVKVKVKLSLYRPWRHLGLREVEVPIFSDIRLIVGGKIVSAKRRPPFTHRKIPGTHFY
jgi:hypothetical protein